MRRLCPLSICVLAPLGLADEVAPYATETLRAKDGTDVAIELWRIDVPENRQRADSNAISLAFLRVRSQLADPGPPVFFLAGGPGGSGIDIMRSHLRGGGTWYMNMLGGDLVAIDQRGVGQSQPNLETDTSFDLPLETPGDRQAMLAQMRQVCREEAARWRARGVDLTGYTTVESADDIDAVRQTLGYDRITLWGGSYGSHLALATLRRHEAHIARLLLSGPEGPDHTLKLPSSVEHGLQRIGELVAEDPTLSEEIPDFLTMLGDVLARLDAGPVYVEVDELRIGISKFDVQRLLAEAIGTLRNSGDQVPALVKAMADDDFEEIAHRLLEERRTWGIGSAMQMVMDCASGASPERAIRIAEEAPDCLLGDAINFPFGELADAWGAPDLGAEYRGPLCSDVPVLFVTGDLDSRTPIRNAEELMACLPNAQLIVVENVGHGDLNWLQPELRDAWHAFLIGEDVGVTRVTGAMPKFRMPR